MSSMDKDTADIRAIEAKEGFERRTFNEINEGDILFLKFKFTRPVLNVPIRPARTTKLGENFFEHIVLEKDETNKKLTTVVLCAKEHGVLLNVNSDSFAALSNIVPTRASGAYRPPNKFVVRYTSDSQELQPNDVKRLVCLTRAFGYSAGTSFRVCKDSRIDAESVSGLLERVRKNEAETTHQSAAQSHGGEKSG